MGVCVCVVGGTPWWGHLPTTSTKPAPVVAQAAIRLTREGDHMRVAHEVLIPSSVHDVPHLDATMGSEVYHPALAYVRAAARVVVVTKGYLISYV